MKMIEYNIMLFQQKGSTDIYGFLEGVVSYVVCPLYFCIHTLFQYFINDTLYLLHQLVHFSMNELYIRVLDSIYINYIIYSILNILLISILMLQYGLT